MKIMPQEHFDLLERLAELEMEKDVLKLQLLNLGWHSVITASEYDTYFCENKRLIEDIKRKISLHNC